MNKTATRLVLLFAALALAATMTILAIIIPQNQSRKISAPIDVHMPKATTGFILRDYSGKIAVFAASDSNNPKYITDFDTAALPKPDRLLLMQGIHAETQEEIAMLLEDFGS